MKTWKWCWFLGVVILLLSTTACAQWGEFGYRDPSQDSVWYKSLLIQSASDTVGMRFFSQTQGTLDIDPSSTLGEVAVIRLNHSDKATNGAGLQLLGRASGDANSILFSLPSEIRKAVIEQDSTKFSFRTHSLPYVFYHQSPASDAVELMRLDTTGKLGIGISPDSLLTVNGGVKIKNINVTGYLQTSADTLVEALASGDNVDLGNNSIVKIDLNDNAGITGITGGVDGRRMTIFNYCEDAGTYYTLTLYHEYASTAANRIILTSGTTAGDTEVLEYGESIDLIYDASASKWRQIGRTHTEAYGGLWADTTGITVTLTSAATFYQLKHLRHDQEPSKNVTFTDSNMTINASGNYMVTCNASFSGSASIVAYGKLYKDGLAKDWLEFERKLNATGDVGSAGFNGIIYLPVGSIIDFRIANDSPSKTISMRHFNLSIHKIN